MKLTLAEAEDLCGRAQPDDEGMFTTDDFTKILCNAWGTQHSQRSLTMFSLFVMFMVHLLGGGDMKVSTI